VSYRDIVQRGGLHLLKLHDSSVSKLLKALYHDYPWELSRFSVKPRHFWKDEHNQRVFMATLRHKLGIAEDDLDTWYKVTNATIVKYGGAGFLNVFDGSWINALNSLFPDHDWDPTKFVNTPRHLYTSEPNRRKLMDRIGRKLGIGENDYAAWQDITSQQFIEAGGSALLASHNSSMSSLLQEIYPERTWEISTFGRKPRNFWDNRKNQLEYLQAFGEKLGISENDLSGWYKVSSTELIDNGATRLLHIHNNRFIDLLNSVYPEHPWDPTKFVKKPKEHWTSFENQVQTLKQIGLDLGIQEDNLERWYDMTNGDIITHGGGSLLVYHNSSIVSLLNAVYPDHDWDPTQFTSARRNKWINMANQRALMEKVRLKLGIAEKDYDAWYKVQNAILLKFGAAQLLRHHNYSFASLMTAIYPDHLWQVWKFPKTRLHGQFDYIAGELVRFVENSLGLASPKNGTV